ncbi:DDHD domain-containing protein [Zychaea mexicana]|uniref:DDHD domain-containing protein n=1 Tax=Zychaea mexicana TaxID=64656 RepID=UPI0022FE4F46|nr:DDHD domain-containing protein [Zychaea mexicana]KAI9492948.1 DDHD domain-containing protein [Zychaea mexicana]
MPDHLVFFIHGVGQQYETYGNIQHHVSTIQKNTQEMLEALYDGNTTAAEENDDHDRTASSSSSSSTTKIQVEFVVIEWHSIVHALVDAKMDQATLENVPKVRLATNQWLMDCMYYFSKPYGQFIIDAICRQCNTAYHDHGDPEHVHMIGFSLGGVAAYDILSMQWKNNSLDTTTTTTTTTNAPPTQQQQQQQQQQQHEPCMCATPNVCVPKLDFEVEHLFTCGSPIAAALIFRGFDYMHYRPPPHTRIHNIFHPYDPLGYRLETMAHPGLFADRLPVRLARAPPRHSRLRLLPRIPNLGIKDFITQYYMKLTYDEDTSSSSSDDDDDDDLDDEIPATTTKTIHDNDTCEHIVGKDKRTMCRQLVVVKEQNNNDNGQEVEEAEEEQQVEPKEFYPRRIDYMLNETVIDAYASEWIIAIKSHFRYWANRDLAFHIAKSLLEKKIKGPYTRSGYASQ